MISRILVPVDASKYSSAAAKYAIDLAKMCNASVVLLHVVETHPYYSVPYYLAAGADSGLEKDIEKVVEGWLTKTEDIAKKQNVEVRHEILFRSKSIVESIVSYAKRNEVDLIVIGSKGVTGFKGLLLGSVARGVIDHATCPVLLVR